MAHSTQEKTGDMDNCGGRNAQWRSLDVDLDRDRDETVEERDYQSTMEAAILELQKDTEREFTRMRIHHRPPGLHHSDSDNLGFESTLEVSGDVLRDGLVERGDYRLMARSGDTEHLRFHLSNREEGLRRLRIISDSNDEGPGLIHGRQKDSTIKRESERGDDRIESQAVFGALAAAAVAVNVALQTISGAGSIALNADTDSSLDHRRFRKRKRKNDEETDFIPAVLSTFADAEAMAFLSVRDSSSDRNLFMFEDLDWFVKPRPRGWWRRLFRVSKPTFEYICQLVKPDIESDTPTSFQGIEGRVITVEKQVAIALRRLASGDSLTTLGEYFGVGESTVSKVIWKFVNSMEKRARDHMKWPEGDEMERVKAGFEMDYGLPNCCGVIDVTHILMELPGTESSVDWFDREQNYSMLVQVVVDIDMKIRDLFTGLPGSVTDSRLLRTSGFYALCESGERLNGPARIVKGVQVREHVIGDSGYPLLPWLINPYTSTGLSVSRDTFNLKHASTKTLVEGSLGRLKGAWKILHKVLWRPDIRRLPSIILVCCLLHNILIEAGEEMEDGVALVGHHDEGYRQQWCLSVEAEGHLIREALAEHIFLNGHH